ncbi:uncharacterized protein [Ptychodera flava]|uniref:uncharacterized protein n=1 Tax=Ptychodera flava TaxID=63121 RepID=UPI00396A84DF
MDFYGRATNLIQPPGIAAVTSVNHSATPAMYAHAPSLTSFPEMYSLQGHRRSFLDLAPSSPYSDRYHVEARDSASWRSNPDIYGLSGSPCSFSSHETAVNSLLTLQNVVFRPGYAKTGGSTSGSSGDLPNYDFTLIKDNDDAKSSNEEKVCGRSSPIISDHSVQLQLPTRYPSFNSLPSWDCLSTSTNRSFSTGNGGYVQVDQPIYKASVRDNPHSMKMSHAVPYTELNGVHATRVACVDGTESSPRQLIRRQYPPTAPGLTTRHGKNQCNICDKTYARPSTLRIHLRTHSDEQPYQCQTCAKTFSQAANLTAHMRTHSGEKPFKCGICERRFSQSSSVTTHMRTHTGARPYKCNFCDKAFADSSTLTKHRRVHTGEKPYRCKLCYQGFSQSGNLNRHMKVHDN